MNDIILKEENRMSGALDEIAKEAVKVVREKDKKMIFIRNAKLGYAERLADRIINFFTKDDSNYNFKIKYGKGEKQFEGYSEKHNKNEVLILIDTGLSSFQNLKDFYVIDLNSTLKYVKR